MYIGTEGLFSGCVGPSGWDIEIVLYGTLSFIYLLKETRELKQLQMKLKKPRPTHRLHLESCCNISKLLHCLPLTTCNHRCYLGPKKMGGIRNQPRGNRRLKNAPILKPMLSKNINLFSVLQVFQRWGICGIH